MDDGHFQKVLDNEVRALQNACKGKLCIENVPHLPQRTIVLALYLNNAPPKITFIIVKKRHNTRFFVREPNANPNVKMLNNVQPGKGIDLQDHRASPPPYVVGTVVDTGIVHPQDFDFYLNSHAAIQGRNHFGHKGKMLLLCR